VNDESIRIVKFAQETQNRSALRLSSVGHFVILDTPLVE
jgi:hypothetical protein